MHKIMTLCVTGPLPRLPTKPAEILLRTIFLWHAIAIFTKDRYGDYMKPTEGVSKNAYKYINDMCEQYGGCWIWICSSKSTDTAEKKDDKQSFVFGAVFVIGVLPTKKFNNLYQQKRLKNEYKHSQEFPYQAIIPSHEHARLELKTPIPVHAPAEGECRWSAVWTPNEFTELVKKLQKPKFI
jgi:hypothetical protein